MHDHPFLLPPPKRCDINLRSRPFFVSDEARVIPIRQIASKEDVLLLIRPRHETDLRPGVRPPLHTAFDDGLLFRRQLGDVIRNDAARPRLGSCGVGVDVNGGIG
jgi:hypothetical protein